ncbi:iron-containing alcohol dehydrogenase [Paraburkholderia fungorum]|uniref:iron-containing alcohol dehydrogenase n=1 Tax=Paraburkholderia fungorum TaxID=134537 RepID=UPI0038B84ED8
MTQFGLMRLPRSVLFGCGQRAALADYSQRIGSRALICTDARLAADPQFLTMIESLRERGTHTLIFDATQPDLPTDSIRACIEMARAFKPDHVIGIGGGSVIDMAKLAALLLTHTSPLSAYYGEFNVPGPVLPVIALPTTAGTGSEVTPVAVVSDLERGVKVGISSPYLIPEVAICDPELTVSCPPGLTAYSAADALTHAIEAFTSVTRTPEPELSNKNVFVGKNVLSDHYALLSICSIWPHLKAAVAHGSDLVAREHLMLGSLAAGCAFGSAGTAAAHALQYPVGNLTHTPHGMGVATLLPYVMAFNRSACVKEFATLARVLGLDAGVPASDDALSHRFIDATAELFAAIGIPRTLAALGLPDDQQKWTAEAGFAAKRLVNNNPRALDVESLEAITRAAYSGERHAFL